MPAYDRSHQHGTEAIPTFLPMDILTFTDQAAAPDAAGELQRNGDRLVFYDGTAARNLALENAATDLTTNGVVYANSSGLLLATAQGAANSVLTANAGAPSFSATPVIGTSLGIGGTAGGAGLALDAYAANTAVNLGSATMAARSTDAFAIDKGGRIGFMGQFNTAGTYTIFGAVGARKENATDGNTDGYLEFTTRSNAGGENVAMKITSTGGVVVGSPTGGDKGAGTINATAVYDDNVLLTDAVWDLYYDGHVRDEDQARWGALRLRSIAETAAFTRQHRHLPSLPGRAEWEAEGSRSLGQMVTALWETVEHLQRHIFELEGRLATMEGREAD